MPPERDFLSSRQSAEVRYELKMVCAAVLRPQVRSWVRLHPEGLQVAYQPRWVRSLYLDTLQLDSLNANLAGYRVRDKIRLRWYGQPEDTLLTNPTLERKRKENMVGYKERQLLNCTLDLTRPYSELLPAVYEAADPAWQPFLKTAVQPVLLNHYWREYFVSADGRLRVTVDSALAVFDQRQQRRPNVRWPTPLTDLVVIEMKAPLTETERLEAAMGFFPLPRFRNSKYVNGTVAGIL